MKQLKANKKVVRPYVGVKMANYINGPTSRSLESNARPVEGVVVLEVDKGSPAEKAGLQRCVSDGV